MKIRLRKSDNIHAKKSKENNSNNESGEKSNGIKITPATYFRQQVPDREREILSYEKDTKTLNKQDIERREREGSRLERKR